MQGWEQEVCGTSWMTVSAAAPAAAAVLTLGGVTDHPSLGWKDLGCRVLAAAAALLAARRLDGTRMTAARPLMGRLLFLCFVLFFLRNQSMFPVSTN